MLHLPVEGEGLAYPTGLSLYFIFAEYYTALYRKAPGDDLTFPLVRAFEAAFAVAFGFGPTTESCCDAPLATRSWVRGSSKP